jgi:hypothetical protein
MTRRRSRPPAARPRPPLLPAPSSSTSPAAILGLLAVLALGNGPAGHDDRARVLT